MHGWIQPPTHDVEEKDKGKMQALPSLPDGLAASFCVCAQLGGLDTDSHYYLHFYTPILIIHPPLSHLEKKKR